jgi:hypothetical protein
LEETQRKVEETQGHEEGLRDMREKLRSNEWKKLRDMSGGNSGPRERDTEI